jgi:hypothetical protein
MNKIRFFPFSENTTSFASPPTPASKNIPEWYKSQPGSINDALGLPNGLATSTIKRCMPIFDMMTAGYILSTPCDIYVDATNPEKLVYSVPAALADVKSDIFATHGKEQYASYPIKKERYHKEILRILPFWSVQTDKGISCIFMQPMHTDESPLMAFSGIIDTDAFISDGHFSFLIEKDFKGVIKQGTPLVQVIPFRRESWEMSLVPQDNADKIIQKQRLFLRSTFLNAYKNKFRSKKDYK